MTNKILFIANWKMFGNLNSVKSIESVINLSKKKNYKNAKIIYCPPYTLLNYFVIKTRKTNLDIGAQNCHYEINTGPYTGSISSTMIKKLGAKYVIIGHSENRSNGMSSTSAARAKFSDERLNFKNIFQAQPPINSGYHFGSRLVIKNNHLYITAGERGQGMIAQDLSLIHI